MGSVVSTVNYILHLYSCNITKVNYHNTLTLLISAQVTIALMLSYMNVHANRILLNMIMLMMLFVNCCISHLVIHMSNMW